MAATAVRGNRYPLLSDTADVPRDVQNLATDLDNAPVFGSGVVAGRPVSSGGSPGKVGRKYYETDAGIDKGILDFDYGQGWRRLPLYETTLVLNHPDVVTSAVGFAPASLTTTQRNALAVGHRPPFLIIWNSTTAQYEYNAGSDATPNWQPLSQSIFAFNTQAASYTLVAADAGKIIELNNAGAVNLTVPLNSSVAFPVGTSITFAQYGVGQITVVATGGVTLRPTTPAKTAYQYAMGTIVKRATDEWYLAGNLVP